MASQKPVADTLADKFAKAQQRGKKDASKGSATRRTRSKGALEDSSSEEEVFQSPTGAAAAPAEPAAPFRQGGLVLRSPVLPPRILVQRSPVLPPQGGGGARPKARAASSAAAVEEPPPLPPRLRLESSPSYQRNPIPDRQRNLLPLAPILKRQRSRASSRASSTSSAPKTPERSSPTGLFFPANDEVGQAGVGGSSDGGQAEEPEVEVVQIIPPPPAPVANQPIVPAAPVIVPPPPIAPAPVPIAAPPAPPVAAIGHVLPAGAGPGVAMAAPAPPAVPAAAAAARRAVLRSQRVVERAVDRLSTAVNDEEPLELVRTRETAVVRARAAFEKLMDELCSLVDDPGVIAGDADRNDALDNLYAYSAAVDEPAEDAIADARQYVSEAEAVLKAKKNTKLPELTVAAFDGKVTEWPRFQAEFSSIIGSRTDLPESSKLAYLVGVCKGEAQRMVKQFRATNTPFADVMAALQARFGRPDLQLKQAFEAIGKLEAGQHTPADTRKVLDELKPLLVTIRSNGVDPDEPALTAMLLTQIGPKMRGEVMTAWHRHCTTQGWVGANLPRMEDFLAFADREVDALMSGQASRSGNQAMRRGQQNQRQQPSQRAAGTALVGAADDGAAGGGAGKKTRRGKRGSGKGNGGNEAAGGATGGSSQGGTALAAKGDNKNTGGGGAAGAAGGNKKKVPACAFCRSDNHRPENCPDGKKLTPRERRRCLRAGCWRCLELGHLTRDCKKQKKPCGVAGCESDHHRFLHGDYDKPE
jgi:hypothetical protein